MGIVRGSACVVPSQDKRASPSTYNPAGGGGGGGGGAC